MKLVAATTTISVLFAAHRRADAFFVGKDPHPRRVAAFSLPSLQAKPQRLEENVEGVVYVNDRCINCAACSNFAPATFSRSQSDRAHIVHQQPCKPNEIRKARAALAACPVAAIRLETLAERRHRAPTPEAKQAVEKGWTETEDRLVQEMSLASSSSKKGDGPNKEDPFPRRFLDDEGLDNVYWVGHHNEKSFGATPYLFQASPSSSSSTRDQKVWIMVDSPKFSSSAVKAVESLTGPKGPDYLFLTHVDDTAGHNRWAQHYPNLKRIFHAGDLGRHNWVGDNTLESVEVLLPKVDADADDALTAYSLDGNVLDSSWQDNIDNGDEVVVLHTPGHSPGSISLYRRPSKTKNGQPGILFTGDTYGFTTRGGGKMTAFSQYGNNLRLQAKTLEKLADLDFDIVAPGHGHPRDYRSYDEAARTEVQRGELQVALDDMMVARRW